TAPAGAPLRTGRNSAASMQTPAALLSPARPPRKKSSPHHSAAAPYETPSRAPRFVRAARPASSTPSPATLSGAPDRASAPHPSGTHPESAALFARPVVFHPAKDVSARIPGTTSAVPLRANAAEAGTE